RSPRPQRQPAQWAMRTSSRMHGWRVGGCGRSRNPARELRLDLVAVAPLQAIEPAEPRASAAPQVFTRAHFAELGLVDRRDPADHLDRRLAAEQDALGQRRLDHPAVRMLAPLMREAASPRDLEAHQRLLSLTFSLQAGHAGDESTANATSTM